MKRRTFLSGLGGATALGTGLATGCAHEAEAKKRTVAAEQPNAAPPAPSQPVSAPGFATDEGHPPDLPASTFCDVSREAKLPAMPDNPGLLDFFKLRFFELSAFSTNHLLQSAANAQAHGQPEEVVAACLFHDLGVLLMMPDHGYWGAQMIAPYVSEKIAWTVRYHQALRFYADPAHGYEYPPSYITWFGRNFVPDAITQRDYQIARAHRWYGEARAITLYDDYSFDPKVRIEADRFTDIIGRNFRQPSQGLGYDDTPSSHMWRSFMRPRKFL